MTFLKDIGVYINFFFEAKVAWWFALMGSVTLIISLIKEKRGFLTTFTALGSVLALVFLLYRIISFYRTGVDFSETLEVFYKVFIILVLGRWLFMRRLTLEFFSISHKEYIPLILFSMSGMFFMLSADNLLEMYVAIELQALPLYGISAMRKNIKNLPEAVIKYYIMGAFSSALMLFGIALLYGSQGSLYFSDFLMQETTILQPVFLFSVLLLFCGFLFKFSLFPFHFWAPDLYETTAAPQIGVFATAPKIAMVALLLRLMQALLGSAGISFSILFLAVSLISIVIGAFSALTQTKIKRVLAYSSINQMGFLSLGFVVPVLSYQVVTIYLVAYMVAFLGVLHFLVQARYDDQEIVYIDHLKGLAQKYPAHAFMVLLLLASLIGIPPLVGFWGKYAILFALLQEGYIVFGVLTILLTVISAFYYLKIIRIMYFEPYEGRLYIFGSPFNIYALLVIVLGGVGFFQDISLIK